MVKEVTLGSGRTIKIASLTLEQIDAVIDNSVDRRSGYQACVDSLNNADPGAWTFDSFRHEFILEEFKELNKLVMEVSGLGKTGEVAAGA